MSNNLVSMNNLLDILSPIKTNIASKIDIKDISQEQKDNLNKTNIIDTTSNNSGFLSNNGKYNNIDLSKLSESADKTNNVYDIFKIKENEYKYRSGTPMNMANYYLSSCIYKNIIHVIGGESQDYSILNNHNIYDIETDTWSTSKSMPTARYKLISQIYNGKIYCIGGENKTNLLKNVEVYDTETNTWSISDSMPTARSKLSSCIYNKKIYCIGGYNQNNLDIIEIYDIENNIWTINNSNMPYKKSHISSVIYNHTIYIIGGNTENGYSNTIDMYDINLNKWNTIIMPMSRTNGTCQLYNDNIYIIYGFGRNQNDEIYCSIEEYNILKNKWTTIKINSSIIDSLTSCIYNDKIYIIGGFCGKAINNLDILTLPYFYYDITLPANIQNKADIIDNTGIGNKILSDKGEYVDIPKGYRFMDSNEVTDFIKILDEI